MPIDRYTLVIAAIALWVLTLVICLTVNQRFRENYVAWFRWKDPFGLRFCVEHPVFLLYSIATFGAGWWVLYG